ncbi:MAG TPA: adenylyltransferase [Eubacteriaceae bacterium]|nr:adenylyltransferase [Eubacteriaceae bacterium]
MKDGEKLRFAKQIILQEIGVDGQKKIFNAKVIVFGAGGLGSPILTYLAGAGVGTIGIVDFDTVDVSNLNRQTLYRTQDIGRKKVDVARETLTELNPDANIIVYPIRMDMDNVEELIEDFDYVVDALDNFTSRFLLSDACYFMKKPLIEGAAVGLYGTVTTILPDETPCYRCLHPQPPADGEIPSCSENGILGMVTGVIGSIQALEVIKMITGFGELLTGRLLCFDGKYLDMEDIKVEKNVNCLLCGKNPSIFELEEHEIKCRVKVVKNL